VIGGKRIVPQARAASLGTSVSTRSVMPGLDPGIHDAAPHESPCG